MRTRATRLGTHDLYQSPIDATCQSADSDASKWQQMAAAPDEDVSVLSDRVDELGVSATEDDENAATKTNGNDVDVTTRSCEPRLWGFETRELYKLALNFYKGEHSMLYLQYLGNLVMMRHEIYIYLDRLNQTTSLKILYIM